MKKIKYQTAALAVALLLCSCSTSDDKDKATPTDPQTLFKEGPTLINEGQYDKAIAPLETLEKEHPISDLAPYAQIRRAYAFYADGKFDDAVLAVDDFTSQYPLHKDIAYAYYLKAVCYYDQIVDVGRDQTSTFKAIDALNEVVERYPETEYARDAKLKAEYAFNNLAGKEMEIGYFYQSKNDLVASLSRYKIVIEKYQTSIFIPEALYRITEIYYVLGDKEQAKRYAAVLGANYLESDWYRKAFELVNDRSKEVETPWHKSITGIW